MKPIYTKVLSEEILSIFGTKEIAQPNFSTEFHFHQECQMTYIIRSEGKRIIGDSVDSFAADELTFLGPELPHVWHNNEKSMEKFKDAHSMALYLNADNLLSALEYLVPIKKLSSFLLKSRRGLLFYGCTKIKLIFLLKEIVALDDGLKKMIKLLEILEILVHTNEYVFLSSAGYIHNYKNSDNDKIDKIFKYVFNNFEKQIIPIEVAKMCNMSKHSFCRFFKSRTNKTFMEFVNEVRISESCKLLATNKLNISNIAYGCGFNSLSNFNRTFKLIKGLTPTAYRMEVLRGSNLLLIV